VVTIIKQKQLRLPISNVQTKTYMQGSCMITIGKIPKKVKSFFKPLKHNVSAHVYSYYSNLVMAICISHASTIQRLVNLLRDSTHRTNHGEFLWRNPFDEMANGNCSLVSNFVIHRDKHDGNLGDQFSDTAMSGNLGKVKFFVGRKPRTNKCQRRCRGMDSSALGGSEWAQGCRSVFHCQRSWCQCERW
jgi:hypothetical protein